MRLILIMLFLLFPPRTSFAQAQQPTPTQTKAPQKPIQDNSFLLEEAYNQEAGVIQHISSFSRSWDTKNWVYAFTEEWPVFGLKHQLSATVLVLGLRSGPNTDKGFGDIAINYRYQLWETATARLRFHRVSASSCPPETGHENSARERLGCN